MPKKSSSSDRSSLEKKTTIKQKTSVAKGIALDALEKAIISELCQDGRKPFQEIARKLSIDEKTVRNRVAKLKESGALRIIPAAEGNSLRDCIVSIVAIKFDNEGRRNPIAVADEIAALPMVSWVGTVMGRYDLLAEVVVQSRQTLAQFQMQELPAISGVGSSEGFLIMSHHGKRGIPYIEGVLHQEFSEEPSRQEK